MTNTEHETTTLVIGGTGKTGRRVAQRLAEAGRPVRIGSRTGTPPFDWDQPETWSAVLDGVGAAYITYQPDLAFPGGPEAVGALAALAVARGTRRLVLLSGRGEEGAQLGEQALIDSGADWTIVRSAFFAQNFSESFLLDPVLAGDLAMPGSEFGEPFVDADDIAEIVVTALTEPGHVGRLYEVTGPRLLTFGDAVATIAAATGRDIGYTPITSEEFADALITEGVPAPDAAGLGELLDTVLDGRNAHTTDGVVEALGRPPRDFVDYVRETAATGIWG